MTTDPRDVDREGYLGSTPTMADVIGWIFAVPTIMASLTVCPYLETAIPRFEKMFRSLGGHLPDLTRFILVHGWWFFTVLPIGVALVMTVWLVRARGHVVKIMVPFAANQIVLAIIGAGVIGISYPILELQKTLSG